MDEAIPLGIFSAIITVENLLVVAVLLRRYKSLLKRSFINRLVVSLALADVIYGAVLLPMTIATRNNVVMPWLTAFALLVSISNVFAIALDRHLAVTKPTEYTATMNRFFVKIICAVWLWSAFLAALPYAWEGNMSHPAHMVYILAVLLVGIFLPYAYILAAYVCIFRAMRRYARDMAAAENLDTTARTSKAEARIAWIFAAVTVIFLISWSPVIFMSAATALGDGDVIPDELSIISWYTLSAGFLVHPLIYAFMKADIHTALQGMCGTDNPHVGSADEMVTMDTA